MLAEKYEVALNPLFLAFNIYYFCLLMPLPLTLGLMGFQLLAYFFVLAVIDDLIPYTYEHIDFISYEPLIVIDLLFRPWAVD